MMATLEKATAFAKRHGYHHAIESGEWEGYQVYEPVMFADGSPAYVGPPLVILAKGRKLRMSTVREAFDYMHSQPPFWSEDGSELLDEPPDAWERS